MIFSVVCHHVIFSLVCHDVIFSVVCQDVIFSVVYHDVIFSVVCHDVIFSLVCHDDIFQGLPRCLMILFVILSMLFPTVCMHDVLQFRYLCRFPSKSISSTYRPVCSIITLYICS